MTYEGSDEGGLFERGPFWDTDIEELLEQARGSHEERLEAELGQIDAQLSGRKEVHEKIIDELGFKVEKYRSELESLYKRSWGQPEDKRLRLKDRIENFQHQLRQEYRNLWRDQQELQQERRQVLRELDEMEDDPLSELL